MKNIILEELEEHADEFETNVMLALFSRLVRMSDAKEGVVNTPRSQVPGIPVGRFPKP